MSRPHNVSPEQVILMARSGCNDAVIASRLNCTERHVRRIRNQRNVMPGNNELVGSNKEHLLWSQYRAMGEPDAKIANRFGRSRQLVSRHFKLARKGGEFA